MSATTAPPRISHCRDCLERVWWVLRYGTGRPMTLAPAVVPYDTAGAMVLIGHDAFTRVEAAQRLAEMFECSEQLGDELARNTYTWHRPHLAVCTHHNRPQGVDQ